MSEALFRLFETLPRQGPGSDACTREALRRLPALPASPRVLDLGCGAGASTLVLAATLRTRVIAVDIHQPFLDQLRATAQARGLAPLVEPRCADMRSPGVPPGSFDLLWSEGAVYLLGFEHGPAGSGGRSWRPGGYLVVIRMLVALRRPSGRGRRVLSRGLSRHGRDCGEPRAGARRRTSTRSITSRCRQLPGGTSSIRRCKSAWRSSRPDADPALAAVIDETRREIELYRLHGDSYGYVFYLLRRSPDD